MGKEDSLSDCLVNYVQQTGRRFIFIIDEWDAMIREAGDNPTAQDRYLNLLRGNGKYLVRSNRESGSGRLDLILRTPNIRRGRAFVMEIKTAKSFFSMEEACEKALRQAKDNQYEEELRRATWRLRTMPPLPWRAGASGRWPEIARLQA